MTTYGLSSIKTLFERMAERTGARLDQIRIGPARPFATNLQNDASGAWKKGGQCASGHTFLNLELDSELRELPPGRREDAAFHVWAQKGPRYVEMVVIYPIST